jgi:thymidine kinase
VRRAVIAGRRVQVFTHRLDMRSRTDRVASHAGLDHPSLVAASADDIRRAVRPETDMVAVDEAHFFGAGLPGVADRLARDGVVVVVAGLDVTFAGRPFEPLPSLMALAEQVDKLTAICTVCGADAIFHARVAPTQMAATEWPPSISAARRSTRPAAGTISAGKCAAVSPRRRGCLGAGGRVTVSGRGGAGPSRGRRSAQAPRRW